MLYSQVLIFGYQLALAAGVRVCVRACVCVRESMSCAFRDSGFAALCGRFAGSQATEMLEELGAMGIDSNLTLLTTSVFWLEGVKDDKLISVDTFLHGGCGAGHAPARGRSRLGGIVARYRPA